MTICPCIFSPVSLLASVKPVGHVSYLKSSDNKSRSLATLPDPKSGVLVISISSIGEPAGNRCKMLSLYSYSTISAHDDDKADVDLHPHLQMVNYCLGY